MRVALDQPGTGDPHKARLGTQIVQVGSAHVSHAGAQPAHQLVHVLGQRSLVCHPSLDPLRHQLAVPILPRGVAIASIALHGAQRSHTAILFIVPSLKDHQFARAFVETRQQRAKHHRIRTGSQRLDDIARELDAAIGDGGHALFARLLDTVHDRRELRHARARDDAGRTDRPCADPDFDRLCAGGDQVPCGLGSDHVAGDHGHVRGEGLDLLDRPQHVLAVSVGRVDRQYVYPRVGQGRDAALQIRPDADRGTDHETPALVDRPVGIVDLFLDVLYRDQAL